MTQTRGQTAAEPLGPDPRRAGRCALRLLASLGLAAVLSLALPVWGALPAAAQSPSASALLSQVAASLDEHGEADLVLTFAPGAPKFSFVRNDTANPGIAFALAARGQTAAAPSNLRPLVREVGFQEVDTVLIVSFAAARPVRLSATTMGGQIVRVHLAPVSAPAPEAPRAAPPRPQARGPGEDGFEVVPLKYADVSEVVGLLTEGLSVKSNDTFTPREPAFGSAGMGGSNAFTPAPSGLQEGQNEPLAQSVDESIAVDRRLNAIILKGGAERIARMKEKIAAIDVPVRSVLLETVFVELDQSGAKNIGLDFDNASNQVGTIAFQTGAAIPSGSSTSKALTSVSLQAAIYAQVRSGRGRIVSKPRIAAQSGGTAKIITGDALPILTSIALSGVNAVSQQVQYVNVGVTLQIAPRVSTDGLVTSHIFCVVSSVTGTSQGYPTISQREAETSATVRDGETFVIGGLSEESLIESSSRFPGLSDLPFLGKIFDVRTGSSAKTELYIVVTPHIVQWGERAGVALLNSHDVLLRDFQTDAAEALRAAGGPAPP